MGLEDLGDELGHERNLNLAVAGVDHQAVLELGGNDVGNDAELRTIPTLDLHPGEVAHPELILIQVRQGVGIDAQLDVAQRFGAVPIRHLLERHNQVAFVGPGGGNGEDPPTGVHLGPGLEDIGDVGIDGNLAANAVGLAAGSDFNH